MYNITWNTFSDKLRCFHRNFTVILNSKDASASLSVPHPESVTLGCRSSTLGTGCAESWDMEQSVAGRKLTTNEITLWGIKRKGRVVWRGLGCLAGTSSALPVPAGQPIRTRLWACSGERYVWQCFRPWASDIYWAADATTQRLTHPGAGKTYTLLLALLL